MIFDSIALLQKKHNREYVFLWAINIYTNQFLCVQAECTYLHSYKQRFGKWLDIELNIKLLCFGKEVFVKKLKEGKNR